MVPERWLALSVRSRAGMDREILPFLLMELGGRGVQETEEGFVTYLPPPAGLEEFLARARERLDAVHPPEGVELSWRWQAQEDWAVLWRRGLGPRKVTPRITVAPSWEIPEPAPGEHLILLDPGMAFGTAEHATTRGCLRLMDPRVRPGDRVADVGAGSGILSIAAALLGASRVLALEMDGISCQVARENLAANGVEGRVEVVEAVVEGNAPLPGSPFHGVVANLQSCLLLPLLPSFRESLHPEGWLILSGVLQAERDGILTAAEGAGLALQGQDLEDEWWSGAFTPLPPQP